MSRCSLKKSGASAILLVMLLLTVVASADVPTEMNVQGRLTDDTGAPLAAGAKDFTFRIFDDETVGTQEWPHSGGEDQSIVTDDDGLWSARVGSVMPLFEGVFEASECWLEITVSDGVNPPETLPRVKLNTSPYAFNVSTVDGATGGEISDWLTLYQLAIGSPTHGGIVELYQSGSDFPIIQAGSWTGRGGIIELYDEQSNQIGVIGPDGSGEGGWFKVYSDADYDSWFEVDGNFSGLRTPKIEIVGIASSTVFRTDLTDDDCVVLPDNAISQDEILDEPGIASANNTNAYVLTTTMTDIETVTLTIPTDGYIVLTGQCWVRLAGTTGANGADIQIDETPGGSYVSPHFAYVSMDAFPTTGGYVYPIYVQRVYNKPQGEYTFRLEGKKSSSATGTATTDDANLTATFYPKSYGGVMTVLAGDEAAQFDHAVALPTETGVGELGSSEQLYEVDLRELELKAARLRAELRQIERDRERVLTAQQQGVER